MVKVVLRRPFQGPDGRIYRRQNDAGRVVVHDFPDDWPIPKTAKPVEEAVQELQEAGEPPEPQTLTEIAKSQHGKK